MKKFIFIILGSVCFAVFIFAYEKADEDASIPYNGFIGYKILQTEGPDTYPLDEIPITADSYDSSVDFKTLQAENPDICAWVEIPGTPISYPVLYHAGDNTYYLNRNSKKQLSADGSIFIEDYNSENFEDPVTVIYGHNTESNAMFGSLQGYYSDSEWFSDNLTILVYLPNMTLEYAVFAAVPYGSRHILYYNDFNNEYEYNNFFDSIYSIRSLNANFYRANNPRFGDRILILSTCLDGDNTRRYLVMAKETVCYNK
jgi:Uncharacterized protein conserved in bacteria